MRVALFPLQVHAAHCVRASGAAVGMGEDSSGCGCERACITRTLSFAFPQPLRVARALRASHAASGSVPAAGDKGHAVLRPPHAWTANTERKLIARVEQERFALSVLQHAGRICFQP